ncbi:helix-turn-helix transcriptional regulator [Cytophagaceae bacterium YF14B1]|uniref:Helix-turn-helix transcriptional regulator n=1 Tax=Xanthocytophaga flava TaxID=3048013 RepID=A0AAE3QPZ1_9BACT|nr:helix-turn-helix transcriptional regulator [Xanthocytophaga flavus]MDJ1482751.1 helix-turn-helix transcriptional regulator [Xanthocytophaga flavus]
MTSQKFYSIKTISEFHQLRRLPAPEHPLISIIDLECLRHLHIDEYTTLTLDFYWIALKRSSNVKVRYGQQLYDFNKGILSFMSPNQIFSIAPDTENEEPEKSGWALLIHPDFLWNTPLAKNIRQYEYFTYSVNEALFLSEKEEILITGIIQNIQQEYHTNIDKFSKQIIISQIETLLSYAERFYHRQFLTREKTNHQILERVTILLTDYFNNENLISRGLPTAQYISKELAISPSYLRSLLKMLTGQNTQQHIHNMLIEKAKEKLSTTELSVSEIAYQLGFEYSQSFSKLFKSKTDMSPLEFRASFD